MKTSAYTLFLILFILISQTVLSQLTLREGDQELEDKTTGFGKLSCKIFPQVKYYTEKRNYLELRFKVKWYKKGMEINDPENNLFLFDNVQKYEDYFKNKGVTVEYRPEAIPVRKQNFKSIEIFNNLEKIQHRRFNSGFLIFNKSSGSPIVIENINTENALIKITLRLVYVLVDGNNYIFKDIAPDVLSWKFLLPDKNIPFDCDALERQYTSKVNKIISAKNLDAANDLKNELNENPDFEKCDNVKIVINKKLSEFISSEEERRAEEERIALEKKKSEKKAVQKPVVSKQADQGKEEQWKKQEFKYEKILAGLESNYNKLKQKSDGVISDLNQRVVDNTKEIASLENIFINKDSRTQDSIEYLKVTYDLCSDVNTENRNTAENLLRELRSFNSTLINKGYACKTDFVKIDKEEGLKKSKKLRDRFSSLREKLEKLEKTTENIQDKIEDNENRILDLLANFDINRMLVIKKIKSKYDSLFSINYDKILSLDKEFKLLRSEFENKRYSKWYFASSRKRFLRKTDKLNDRLALLQINDSVTKKNKNEELALYEFDSNFDKEQNFEKVIVNLKPGIIYLRTDIEEWPTRMFPIFYLVLFLVITSILIFGARVYYKALKVKKIKLKAAKPTIVSTDNVEKSTSGGITITKTIGNDESKGKGLDQVRAKSGIDFLELDLSLEWDDTTVKKIYFERNCIIKTYRFFEDSIRDADTNTTANETGGYLIGRWDKNPDEPDKFDVSLEDFIEPGDDATFSRYQLNFGAKIGIKLQKVLENCRQKENKDFIMTAWFHSHPGLKIFLSDYDLTVQKDFSRNDDNLKMIALVIDPYTEKWDTGIFSYKTGGEMNNAKDSKQFFSLDNMYQWALSPVATENSDNFFSAPLQHIYPDTAVNNVFFSNHCILQIKRYIEDNNANYDINDIMVFISGEKRMNRSGNFDIELKNLHNSEDKNTQTGTGNDTIQSCIIKTSDDYSSISESLSKPEIVKNEILVVLAYNYDKNTLIAISKNKAGVFNDVPDAIEKISLTDMISWTRKRK